MDYQQRQMGEICDKLRKMSVKDKRNKFKQLANSNNKTDLGTIFKAITTHIAHLGKYDKFSRPDLIISSGQVRFDIPMVNEYLNVKYESSYFDSQNWIYEACLDIYLGLHEFGFMNYKNN